MFHIIFPAYYYQQLWEVYHNNSVTQAGAITLPSFNNVYRDVDYC